VNKKIRVTYLIDRLRYFAGTEKHLYQTVSLIDKNEFSVNIITFECFDEIRKSFSNAGVTIDVFDIDKLMTIKTFSNIYKLANLIKQYRPDIVQTFHFTSDTIGVIAAKLAGVPVIISSRRDMGDLKTRRQILMNKLINPHIDKFISVCERVKEGINEAENIPLNKIHTIYNGVEVSRYEYGENATMKARDSIGIERNRFIVGIACLFRPEKDVELFFKAVSKIHEYIEKLTVLAVGTGPNIDKLKDYCRRNGLSDRVIFTGYVNDVRPYVMSMDVVCLTPVKNEGLSNAILEEMAMGKPVIATDVGGNAELIVHGENGYIISPGDADDLAEKIMHLYRDQALRRSMGLASRKRVEQLFTIDIVLENIQNHYRDILNEKVGSDKETD
jgi:glycosyltransferase involved in cell wall biosynthesis